MKIAPALAAVLLLSGCVAAGIGESMKKFNGRPVSELVAKLGFPTEERVIAGHKVYIWSTSNFVEGTNYQCRIRAILDERDNIVQWDRDGNEGGCSNFLNKLVF